MPYKSKAQRAYMYMKHPKIAKEWTEKYGSGGKDLPEHAPKKKKKRSPWLDMKPKKED